MAVVVKQLVMIPGAVLVDVSIMQLVETLAMILIA